MMCLVHSDTQQAPSQARSPATSCGATHKPLKRTRGLSKYYGGISKSFSSLELALSTQFGESALALAKRPSMHDLGAIARRANSTLSSHSRQQQGQAHEAPAVHMEQEHSSSMGGDDSDDQHASPAHSGVTAATTTAGHPHHHSSGESGQHVDPSPPRPGRWHHSSARPLLPRPPATATWQQNHGHQQTPSPQLCSHGSWPAADVTSAAAEMCCGCANIAPQQCSHVQNSLPFAWSAHAAAAVEEDLCGALQRSSIATDCGQHQVHRPACNKHTHPQLQPGLSCPFPAAAMSRQHHRQEHQHMGLSGGRNMLWYGTEEPGDCEDCRCRGVHRDGCVLGMTAAAAGGDCGLLVGGSSSHDSSHSITMARAYSSSASTRMLTTVGEGMETI